MASTITNTSICNSALVKLGAERITSLDDNTKRARLCKEQYPKVKEDLLMSHAWNFAITRKTLAAVTHVPTYEFGNAFAIPQDAMRILATSLNEPPGIGERKWAVETDPNTQQKYLLCNQAAVDIKYLKAVDEAYFTPAFAELLAMKLAFDLCYSITQSANLTATIKREYDEKLKRVRSYDAAEGSVPQVEADDFLLARLSNGPGFYTFD